MGRTFHDGKAFKDLRTVPSGKVRKVENRANRRAAKQVLREVEKCDDLQRY